MLKRKIYPVLITLIVLIFTLSGCERKEDLYITSADLYFDTVVNIKIWGTTDESLLDGCADICEKYENLFSRTIMASDISKLNNAGGKAVTLDSETIELLRYSIELSKLSDGAFDITTAPLSDLWKVKDNPGIIPDTKDIEDALSHIDYRNIYFEGDNKAGLTDGSAAVDLGALAKGYVADRLKDYLVSNEVKRAIIDLGGNIVVIGEKNDGSPYNIGIQKPFDDRNEVLLSVPVKDKSVVSSGTYERYFEKDGRIYHHIFDSKTGFPVDNDLNGVTIISDSSLLGDALSTTCFILGKEQGMELLKQYPDVKAVFIDKEMNVTKVNE